MVFATHQHEPAIGKHMSSPSGTPPHPTPLDGHTAPALGSALADSNTSSLKEEMKARKKVI